MSLCHRIYDCLRSVGTFVINSFLPILALIISFFGLYISTQGDRLSHPTTVLLTGLQIWEKDKGGYEDPKSAIPILRPGQKLEGALTVVNSGPRSIVIRDDSDAGIFFETGPVSMIWPLWGRDAAERTKLMTAASGKIRVRTLAVGESGVFTFDTTVPSNWAGQSLRIYGAVNYAETLWSTWPLWEVRHGLQFVQQYEPSEKRFVCIFEQHQ